MSFTLPLDITLEALSQRVADVAGRPAFIVAGTTSVQKDTLFRFSGETEFRKARPLELYLSGRMGDRCTGDRETEGVRERLFDLQPPVCVYIAVPALPGDSWKYEHRKYVSLGAPWFEEAGAPASAFGDSWDPVPCSAEEAGSDLAPFVTEWPGPKRGSPKWTGLKFHKSGDIEVPNVRHATWFTDGDVKWSEAVTFSPMCPPAQYQGTPHALRTDFNTFGLAKMPVGSCIVCRGSSGETVHLATMTIVDNGVYPYSPICRACAPEVFKEWISLMGFWKPV